MRDRLIELINFAHNGVGKEENKNKEAAEIYADYLLANGVIVLPCKVGDKVYYVSDSPINLSVQANTIYDAHISRMVTTQYGTTLVVQIHNSYGCTEIPDINDFGKTVFLTKEEAEAKLKEGVRRYEHRTDVFK